MCVPIQVLRVGGSELSEHLRLLHHEHGEKISICRHRVHLRPLAICRLLPGVLAGTQLGEEIFHHIFVGRPQVAVRKVQTCRTQTHESWSRLARGSKRSWRSRARARAPKLLSFA